MNLLLATIKDLLSKKQRNCTATVKQLARGINLFAQAEPYSL